MGRIEEIMSSQNLDMHSKMLEIKKYYKEALKEHTYIELFEGLKEIRLSKKFKEKYKDVPDQYKTALEEAIEELMKEKIKEIKTSSKEMDEINKYFAEELDLAKKTINKAQQALISEEETKKRITDQLKEDDNYKRFAVAYQDQTIDENGKILMENEINKVNSAIATDTIKLINEYKKDIK